MNAHRQEDQQRAEPSPKELIALMVERGDVHGLLEWMRARPAGLLPVGIMEDLQRAIRKQAQRDLPGLIDASFGEILSIATILLVR